MQGHRAAVLATATLFALSAVGTPNASAHGGDISKIHGCVDKKTRVLRIVDASTFCGPSGKGLHWDRTGAAGPQGEVGPTGPEGPAGPAGRAVRPRPAMPASARERHRAAPAGSRPARAVARRR